MKIAIIVTDNRDEFRRYDKSEPFFGPAPSSLLEGFSNFPEHEFHIVCCVKREMQFPKKIARNIYYHAAVVPRWGWLKSAYLPCISAVRAIIRQIRPNIVHGQGTERYAALCAVYSGAPSVLTIHGNMRSISKGMAARPLSFYWLTARLEAFTLPRAAGVICLSRYTRDQVKLLAKKSWIVPNAAGTEFFQERERPSEPPILLCPALICPYKNQNELIRALDGIAPPLSNRMVFAGGIDEKTVYAQEFLDLLKARSWCEYAGQLNNPELIALYGKASLIVLPSLEDNCPMAILEGAAGGVPIAASAVCGNTDLVTDGENGALFDPYNHDEISTKIGSLLSDRTALARMAREARSRAESLHRPRVIAAAHLAIYQEILASTQRKDLSARSGTA